MSPQRSSRATEDAFCRVPGERRIEPERLERIDHEDPFRPVEKALSAEQALAESQRCLASVLCTYCEVCQLLCPDLCITRDEVSGHILIDLTYCKGCGLCAYFCPKGALAMVEESSET